MAKVVIVIPTYNEVEGTKKMIPELAKVVSSIKKHTIEVLYVDDTSPDGTYKVIKKYMKKYKWLHLVLNKEKAGIGGAYVKAFKYAMDELKADYVMEFDADFQHRPEDIPVLLEKIDDGYDLIIGSRYVSGGTIPHDWGFKRKFFSVIGNLVCRIGFLKPSIRDFTTGFKLTKVKGVLDSFPFEKLLTKQFAYKIHMTAHMAYSNLKIIEVPIVFKPREQGESKLIKNELDDFLRVIILFQLKNPAIQKFLKFAIVGFIGFLVNYFGLLLFKQMPFVDTLAQNFKEYKDHSILQIFATPSSWAAAFGAELAIVSNFLLNNFWTFKNDKISGIGNYIKKFLGFNATSFGAVVIQFIVIGVIVSLFGESFFIEFIGLVVAIGFFVIPYNYFMYNVFIWKSWDLKKMLKRK